MNDITYPVAWTDDLSTKVTIRDTFGGITLTTERPAQVSRTVLLPTDPAERRRLAEAILGEQIEVNTGPTVDREVADVIYVDELPEVTPITGEPGWYRNPKLQWVKADHAEGRRQEYLYALAAQRADEAASKVDDEQVEALADAIHGAWDTDDLMAVARAAIDYLRGQA